MADRNLNVRLIIRNDTTTNWITANPVLLKGEMGVEIDTRKFKFGDGTTTWSALQYAGGNAIVNVNAPTITDSGYDVGTTWVDSTKGEIYTLVDNTAGAAVWKKMATVADLTALGSNYLSKEDFATNAKANQGYVDKAILADSATKLATAYTTTFTGDVTGNYSTDGSAAATAALTLTDSGVTAGDYTKVTVDSKGRVTAGAQASADDITGLGTAAKKDIGTASGEIPVLGTDGKLDKGVLPAIAITDTFVVDSEAAMLALAAQQGDVAVRTDIKATFILKGNDPSVLANWVELETPADAVASVNGKTGVVTLTTDDVAEGTTNLYYTDARATANFNTNIANTEHTALKDGADILMSTDTYILNGGNA